MPGLHRNVAILIIRGGSEYVLQWRDDKPDIADPGVYSPWGGGIEGDETPELAAIRELEEETGMKFQALDLIGLGSTMEIVVVPEGRDPNVEMHYFAAEISAGTDFDVYEGQGKVSLPKPFKGHPKASVVTRHAIERYETR